MVVAKYFKSVDTFSCISNPSIIIHASNVNDDYCDCPDGSDEPGTSACSYLLESSSSSRNQILQGNPNTTFALPGYYCKNKGHQPAYISFLSVNDGVCDYELCCDGSDEWARAGGITCENKCKDIGKEWRKHNEQRQKSLGNAARKRKELVIDAAKLRKEVEDRIQTLGTQIEGSIIKVKDLEATLADVEQKERGKVVKSTGKGSKLSVLAGLAKDRIEELRAALTNVREQRDTANTRVIELEALLSTFKEEYNPNFNDEGVKRAVRSWEDYAAREKSSLDNTAEDQDLDEIVKPDEASGVIQWAEFEDDDESDVDVRKCPQKTKFGEQLIDQVKSTKSKDIFPNQSENGLIRSYAIYGLFS